MLRGSETNDIQMLLGHSTIDMTISTYTYHDKFQNETCKNLNDRECKNHYKGYCFITAAFIFISSILFQDYI